VIAQAGLIILVATSFVGYRTDSVCKQSLIAVEGRTKGGLMAQERKRVKHTDSFEERLAKQAIKYTEAAEKHPIGSRARASLLRRARQVETASHINDWLSSRRLQPPKALGNLLTSHK
jgi:hypothetical protein